MKLELDNAKVRIEEMKEDIVKAERLYQAQQQVLNRQLRASGLDSRRINEGDIVVRNHKPDMTSNPKLQPRFVTSYHGPWQVIQAVNQTTMMISDGKPT